MSIAIRDVMARVGHANYETTMIYTHKQSDSQQNTVKALDEFALRHNFIETDFKHWTTKYSGKVYDTIKNECYNANTKVFSLEEFKELLGLDSNYSVKYISANIFPNLKKDLTQHYKKFEILCIKENRRKIVGFELSW
ncbi:integrase [Streptococcus agalactiae]|nr:integrase [Streptococcus agalactiae]CNG56456.1 integrase [Streptococcus agalactiae]